MTKPVIVCMLFSIGLSIIEALLHDDYFGMSNVKTLLMTLSPLILVALGRYKIVRRESEMGGMQHTLTMSLLCAVILLAINIVAGLFTFQVISLEILMFYINISISEEMLYRVLIVSVLILLLQKVIHRTQNVYIAAVILDGIIFSLAHYEVYLSSPSMMLATLLGGMVLAFFFIYTKNPFVTIFAHVLNNFLAAGGILLGACTVLVM